MREHKNLMLQADTFKLEKDVKELLSNLDESALESLRDLSHSEFSDLINSSLLVSLSVDVPTTGASRSNQTVDTLIFSLDFDFFVSALRARRLNRQ